MVTNNMSVVSTIDKYIGIDKNNNPTQFEEIKNLAKKFDSLFEQTNISTQYIFPNESKPIEFNYNFTKELADGFIEYKRTLLSYSSNDKIEKLIRQIYWRIYEGLVTDGVSQCYYIIGIEDSGEPSYLNVQELSESVNIILTNLNNSEIKYTSLYLTNTKLNYKFAVVKFWIDNEVKKIEYF